MSYKEIAEREEENTGRVFLYVEGERLAAYELSAFVVGQLFPHLRLYVSLNPGSPSRLLKVTLPFDLVLESTMYPLAVSDDFAEMTFSEIPESTQSAWRNEFEDYKREVLGINKMLCNK